jgi:hypothetical protein
MRKDRRAKEKLRPSRPNFGIEFIYTQHPVPHQVAWYKWEFLRRNREYRADHKQFIDTFGSWFRRRGFWYDHDRREEQWTKADEDHFYDNIAPAIGRLCEKWKIGNLYPPKWQFDRKHARRKIGSREISPPTGIAAELNWDFDVMRELLEMGFTGTADSARRYRSLVLIEFDLNRPMKDLMWYAKYVLTRALENYKAELLDLGLEIPRGGRRRLGDYEVHLAVWDLKQRGKSVSDIAAVTFPAEDPNSALQKVRDHLKAAQKLISGGYAEIS